jgi:RHS repeat-associated protein
VWTVRDLGGNVLREFRFVKPPANGGGGFAADAVTTGGDPDDSIFADSLEGADTTGWDETSADSSAATAVAARYWEIRDYVYRDSLLLGSITNSLAGGTVVWHDHLDHLGTPRLLTDAQGNVVARHDYLPYGEEVTFAGEGDTKKFTGHQRDAFRLGFSGDDLDYMHARSYSGMLGRFTSVDPIGGNRKAPQSWNRYAYGLGSPLRYTDPRGLDEESGLEVVPCPEGQAGPCYRGSVTVTPGMIDFRLVGPTNGPNTLRDIRSDPGQAISAGQAPQSPPRGPDYVSGTFGFALPNPYTLTFVGISINLTLTRYGDLLLGGGPNVGKSALFLNGSLVAGGVDGSADMTPSVLLSTLSEWANNVSVGGGISMGMARSGFYGPRSAEFGLSTPSVGVSAVYSVPIQNLGVSW